MDSERSVRFSRARRVAAGALLVLALVVGIAANVTVWTKDTLLDTDEWVGAVEELPQEEAVADAIADLAVDELLAASEDLRAEAGRSLPEELQFLAGLIRPALEEVIREQASQLIQSDEFQVLWVEANRRAHETLAAVLSKDDPNDLVTASGGEIRLDLSEVLAAVRGELGESAENLLGPPEEGEGVIVIANVEQLNEAQDAVDTLEGLAIVLPVAFWVLLAGAIAVAVDRRRFLVAVGLGVAAAVLITLIALGVAREEVISLIEDETTRLAGDQAWEVVTSNLIRQSWVIFGVGLVVAAGAWVAGPSRGARAIRDWIRNFALSARGAAGVDLAGSQRVGESVRRHRNWFQALGVGVALIVLIAWDRPSWVTVVVVAALLAVWLIALEVLAPRRRDSAESPPDRA